MPSNLGTISSDSNGITEIRDNAQSSLKFSQSVNAAKPQISEFKNGLYRSSFSGAQGVSSADAFVTGASSIFAAFKIDVLPPANTFYALSNFRDGSASKQFSDIWLVNYPGYVPYVFLSGYTGSNAALGCSDSLSINETIVASCWDGVSVTSSSSYVFRINGESKTISSTGNLARNSPYDLASIGSQINSAGSVISGTQFNGSLFEIVYLPSFANLYERRLIEGYLSHKWAIPLAADHPFANRPPLIGD